MTAITSRWLPYPLLTLSLLVMWLFLNSFSLGHFLLGSVIAIGASRVMVALQPQRIEVRRWKAVARLVVLLLWEILRSNIAVASIILRGRRTAREAGFLVVPLDIKHPMGLALLSCILTSTPGTAWLEYRSDTGRLLLHVLDLFDEQAWIDLIKNRYERMLMEIFE